MYISETQARVRYAETDQMGIVYYGNYAQYFEIGRVESIRQLGYSYKDMEREGVMMPVVEMHIKYLRSALYDDLITIKTTLRELPADYKITFLQEVFNEQKKLLTSGTVVLYFLDIATRKKNRYSASAATKTGALFYNRIIYLFVYISMFFLYVSIANFEEGR